MGRGKRQAIPPAAASVCHLPLHKGGCPSQPPVATAIRNLNHRTLADARLLVSVDSLSSLFVATGDARIAHPQGEPRRCLHCVAAHPNETGRRPCAVTPTKRKPTLLSQSGFRKGRTALRGILKGRALKRVSKGQSPLVTLPRTRMLGPCRRGCRRCARCRWRGGWCWA